MTRVKTKKMVLELALWAFPPGNKDNPQRISIRVLSTYLERTRYIVIIDRFSLMENAKVPMTICGTRMPLLTTIPIYSISYEQIRGNQITMGTRLGQT